MILNLGILLLGLGFLVAGSHWLVDGASRLAKRLGISALAIGLTVVSFGTSAPELFVSLQSALMGKNDIALGNVVGSNIFNVLFILGICALILPLKVASKLYVFDVPVMIVVSIFLYVFCLDFRLSLLEGAAFLLVIFIYTVMCYSFSRKETDSPGNQTMESGNSFAPERNLKTILKPVFWVVLGLVFLVLGARWLVEAAVAIAHDFGISERVIALTIVAAGTSLPEVAASVAATIKGERDIAIGNVIGSNIFNIAGIAGISAVVSNQGLIVNPQSLQIDIPFMLVVAVLCYPIFRSQSIVSRWEGFAFFSMYAGYTTYLIKG